MVQKQGNLQQRSLQKGFTLIELLVVIAIIALLLSVVIPALNRAKDKAREVVCRSNLHQWGVVFLSYTVENNDKFWIEYTTMVPGHQQGQWMPVLSPYYGDVDKFRLCPSAKKPHPDINSVGIGATHAYWGDDGSGGILMETLKFTRNPDSKDKNFGSYGTNLWINDINPPDLGWRGHPDWHWVRPSQNGSDRIPMVMDCTWYGTNLDNPGVDSSENPAEVSRSYWENQTYWTINWENDISRLLIDRHNEKINICFMNGSVDNIKLTDLWTLKWHKEFQLEPDPVPIPWMPDR